MRFFPCLLGLGLWLIINVAAYSFTISDIQITGLNHVSRQTVMAALPIHKGQEYRDTTGEQIIQALFNTGLFDNIELGRKGNTLIIHVQERPIISFIVIQGNNNVKTDQIRSVLSSPSLKIQEGTVYNPEIFKQVAPILEYVYAQQGYYAAKVTAKAAQSPDHPGVVLTITIDEGSIVKVGGIHFIGNHVFSQRKLRSQMDLKTVGLFTWFSHKDRYSKELLQMDLTKLSKFYLNHGYAEFKILSQKVTLSPDKKKAFITISVSEGPVYHFTDYTITGDTRGLTADMQKAIQKLHMKPGDVFSYQVMDDAKNIILYSLANRGYAHANVNAAPQIDQKTHTVALTFFVVPGPRIYVRRINFIGNTRTDQRVLRHDLLQYEGTVYSKANLERSKQLLNWIPAVQSPSPMDQPSYEEVLVPDHLDQVDIDYHVKEAQTAQVRLQGGYSSLQGFLYGLNFSESNFMGTGKSIGLGFDNSQVYNQYFFNYINPYYGQFGLSRSVSAYYNKYKDSHADDFNMPTSYASDGYGLNISYAYPISAHNSISFGYGFERLNIYHINQNIMPPSYLAFLKIVPGSNAHSRNYNQFKVNAAWSYQDLDQPQLPTRGLSATVSLEVGLPIIQSSNGYYLLDSKLDYYLPLWHDFILNTRGEAGYGSGFANQTRLPFYKNFFLGGIGSVPAFTANSLGPYNLGDDSALGGNLLTVFGVHLILPPFISDKIRTAILFDVGNVFQMPLFQGDLNSCALRSAVRQACIVNDDPFSVDNLRYSIGVGFEWITPFAPISLTVAFPINKRTNDQTQAIQFALTMAF